MATPEALLDLYNQILSSQSTELIRDIEANLLEAEVQESFLVSNTAILCSQAVPQAVRKFALVYLSKAAKRMGRDKNYQRASISLQHFLGLLGNPMVELEMKAMLVPCLEAVLSASTFKGLRQEFKMRYVSIVNGAENTGDGELDYASIVFCGKALLNKDSFSEELRELVRITSPSLLKLGIRLCKRFQNEQNKQSLLYISTLLKEYSQLIKNYFKKMALLQLQSIKIVYLKELQEFVTFALDLSHRENTTNLSIYIAVNNDDNISKLLNAFKTNIIVMLTSSIRLIVNYTKHPKLVATNALITKMPQLITLIVKSTSSLLQITPYYQLPLQIKLVQTLSEVLNFLINCLRLNYFYEPLAEYRHQMIENIILPCLSTTPQDVQNFYEDPIEFVEASVQIINRNPPSPSDEDIREYQTLRTLSAQILNAICTFQDGTLSLVTEMTINVLEDKVAGDKSLTLLVLSILSPLFKNRKDLCTKVGQVIIRLFQCCAIPVLSSIKKKEDLEYAFLLMTIAKMFPYISQIFKDIVSKIYKVGVAVIQSPSVSEAHRFFVFQLFNKLANTTEGEPYAQDLLLIYNHLLNTSESPSFALLDSYYFLIKYNSQEFKRNPAQILEGIRLSCLHIQREVNHPQPVLFLLSKCWNMIRQIGENDDFIPALIPQIEVMILPLMKYIDGVRNLDFEEDVFMLLTSFIQRGKTVTANQLKMMEILPRIFYGIYGCRFGYSFRVIQLLIYYGSAILSTDLQAIHMLIQMSITSISTTERNKKPMSETQNCEGVLILQSLITKCGAVFPAEYWTTIIKCCLKKLQQKITFRFLSSNIYALLSLVIIHSHRFFSNQQNQILLGQIISKIQLFDKVQYAPKVIVAGLSQILYHSQNQFVQRRFSHILDIIITMLQITTSRKQNYFQDDQPQEEKQYCNTIIMVKNDIKQLDQFSHFRKQVDKLKAKNLPLLQKSVSGLPKAKKDFLTHILRVQRVANEPRQIYRIKR